MKNWRRALDIGSLSALALAHPLFDVLSQSPEFFVARNSTVAHVVSLACIVCVLVPVLLFGVVHTVARIRTGAGTLVHNAILAVLVIAMVMTWLNRVDGLAGWISVPLSVAAGVALAIGYRRAIPVQLFVTALSPAVIVVPSWFLLNDDVRDALVPTAESFATVEFDEAPPVVFIVFDEFPLSSLLDENYEIDAGRYPNFSALAAHSYWFRNTTTVSSQTMWAIPAILSGTYPLERGAVPTRRYYPNNLFTVLSERYEMTVFGRFLRLCPASTCAHDLAFPEETVGRLVADSAVVLAHILLPEPWTRYLPTVTGDWAGFARARWLREFDGNVEPNQRDAEFDRFLASVEKGRDAHLYFLHSLLPHMPFEYVPSGRRYRAPDYQGRRVNGKRLFEATDRGFVDALYQRHLLQVGFVDRLIGRLMDRLREQQVYDDALIIVTSDHGASYLQGFPRRALTYDTAPDIALVPLFVKLPGQLEGVVSDRNAQTIDILPTIADVLSISLPFGVDGQSLLGASRRGLEGNSFVRRTLNSVRLEPLGDVSSRSQASLQRKVSTLGTHSNTRLYDVGPSAGLLGTDVSALAVARRSGVTLASSNFETFDEVDRSEPELPLHITGVLDTRRRQPVQLAIALNGVIAATTESYRQDGTWAFAAMLAEDMLRDGPNDVRLFTIERDRKPAVLRRVRSGNRLRNSRRESRSQTPPRRRSRRMPALDNGKPGCNVGGDPECTDR